jgi:hypothetical protein
MNDRSDNRANARAGSAPPVWWRGAMLVEAPDRVPEPEWRGPSLSELPGQAIGFSSAEDSSEEPFEPTREHPPDGYVRRKLADVKRRVAGKPSRQVQASRTVDCGDCPMPCCSRRGG